MMNRHSSLGCIGVSVLVGMIAGAAATMLCEPKTRRSTRRCARNTLRSVEGLLEDIKARIL